MLRFLILLFIVTFFSACQESQVADSLSQQEAHEIVSQLNHYGIKSSIELGAQNKSSAKNYAITVDQKDYLASIDIISQLDLISADNQEFNQLTESPALIPNKQYELYRLDRSLALQLEDSVLEYPEVNKVKAVVRLNSVAQEQDPAVSLVVSGQVDIALANQIKKFIRNILPEVSDDRILVSISGKGAAEQLGNVSGTLKGAAGITVPLVPFLIWKVPAGAEEQLGLAALVLLVLALIAGFFIARLLSWRNRKKVSGNLQLPRSSRQALGIDEVS